MDAAAAASAVSRARPWGIDVWESVEREPGRLDRLRLGGLIRSVREAGAQQPPASQAPAPEEGAIG